MKHLIIAFLILFSAATFAQVDTGEIDKDGRIVYEKTLDGETVEIEHIEEIDPDMYRIFDHKGVFRIGVQKDYNRFPYDMFVKYDRARSMLYITVNYKFDGTKIIITAKNTIDDLAFALGIHYYIVIRYTKK